MSDVAGIGIASVTHQAAVREVMAIVHEIGSERPPKIAAAPQMAAKQMPPKIRAHFMTAD
ncbi:MAG: hypothetical protein AAB227_00390 [Pseudomonadota bacterium]